MSRVIGLWNGLTRMQKLAVVSATVGAIVVAVKYWRNRR